VFTPAKILSAMSNTATKTMAADLSRQLAAKAASYHLNAYDETPLNTRDIPQDRLDLANKTRCNIFPWRGQFSPELVDLLLSHYAGAGDLILDPFAGVGTTLFEAARRSLPAVGVEINPAAFCMASTVVFLARSEPERKRACEAAARLLRTLCGPDLPLWAQKSIAAQSPSDALVDLLRSNGRNNLISNVLLNTLIRLMESADPVDPNQAVAALRQHESIVMGLPVSSARCEVFHADARAMPVEAQTADLVITSPPYINVFNYHQNCRRAMEMMGWDLLGVAKSEFGANRKHRANRFLTVIQYCLDMAMALTEIKRVLKPSGRAIFIMGRVSSVRGLSFRNGRLVGALATEAGFNLTTRQERKFTNKFGELIYEDILHLTLDPIRKAKVLDSEPRGLAVHLLDEAQGCKLKGDVAADIRDAIATAEEVNPSPVFKWEDCITP